MGAPVSSALRQAFGRAPAGRRGRLAVAVGVAILMAAGGAPASAQDDAARTPSVRTFANVTAATLTCLAENSRREHGAVNTVDPGNPNIVTSETHYFGLTRIVRDFDPRAETATYRILRKPAIASYAQVWDGIRNATRACS
jgi:hypothetical protein